MALAQYRASVERWMLAGRSLDEVEQEIIEPAALRDDEKAALWMWAWSFLDPDYQRKEAMAHMERLEAVYD